MCKLFITFLLFIIVAKSFAQSTATASAFVTIETSYVGVTSLKDSGPTAYIIAPVIKPGANFKNEKGSRALVNNDSNIVSITSFNLIGRADAFSITVPSANITAQDHARSESVQLSSFTSTSSNPAKTDGKQTIVIRATMYSGDKVTEGRFVSNAPLHVIVNYN